MTIRKYKLDPKEREIEAAFERGEYVPVKNMEKEIQSLQRAAKAHGNKNKRINIRMTSWDYRKAQEKALMEGLPYQTFLASVLHKYLSGQLIERKAS
jgi:predicted DNA binding CopG/RHH family protein